MILSKTATRLVRGVLPSGKGSSNKAPIMNVTTDSSVNKPQTIPDVENSFSDVTKGHWAYEAVCAMAKAGIISGKGNNLFDPDSPITRAEFVKIIVIRRQKTHKILYTIYSNFHPLNRFLFRQKKTCR